MVGRPLVLSLRITELPCQAHRAVIQHELLDNVLICLLGVTRVEIFYRSAAAFM